MAVLSKIRERSMFLIIIIGLALFAFVLDPSTLGDFFNSSKVNEVGEVNGESISRQEFSEELEVYKRQAGSRVSEMQASKTVWNVAQAVLQTPACNVDNCTRRTWCLAPDRNAAVGNYVCAGTYKWQKHLHTESRLDCASTWQHT